MKTFPLKRRIYSKRLSRRTCRLVIKHLNFLGNFPPCFWDHMMSFLYSYSCSAHVAQLS